MPSDFSNAINYNNQGRKKYKKKKGRNQHGTYLLFVPRHPIR